MDFDRSDCEYWEVDDKKILAVSLPVLRSEIVEGYDIFRLQEDVIPIFVSERIKQIVEKNNLTGFLFWEVPVV